MKSKLFFAILTTVFLSRSTLAEEILGSISTPGAGIEVSAGNCDFKAGSPAVFQHESGVSLCTASFVCPRSKTVEKGAGDTVAFDNKSCPPLKSWPARNIENTKRGKLAGLEAALPNEYKTKEQLDQFEVIEGNLRCRYTRRVHATYHLVAKDEWAAFTAGEVTCTGPGAENMPPFFACKHNGTTPYDGGEALIARTVSDCWKEENRLPFTPASEVKIMTEPEFEHLAEKRRRDSNNTLLANKDRVAQGQAEPTTASTPGIQHSGQRNPQSLVSTTTPTRRILGQ